MFRLAELLPPDLRKRLALQRTEITRLYALDDVALATELLSLARAARALRPEYHGTDATRRRHYGTEFVWTIIPELAHALAQRAGVDLLLADEEGSAELRVDLATGQVARARARVGAYLANTSHFLRRPAALAPDDVDPWDLLVAEVVNGNPVAAALDRIAPPTSDPDDWLSLRILEICAYRDHPLVAAWQPSLNSAESRTGA